MRSHFRTAVVLALACALLGCSCYNVDVRGSWVKSSGLVRNGLRALAGNGHREPRDSLAPMAVSSGAARATSFANAFRATAVGFAASSILPARAGEVIRPYFLARTNSITSK